jgi:hypothetical protein
MSDGFSILAVANKAHDLVRQTRRRGIFLNMPGRRAMFFIKTGGVRAGWAGYFFKCAGFRRDISGISQLVETQLANIITY